MKPNYFKDYYMEELLKIKEKYKISDKEMFVLSKLESNKANEGFIEKTKTSTMQEVILKKYRLSFFEKQKFLKNLKFSTFHTNEEFIEKYKDSELSVELQNEGKKGLKRSILILGVFAFALLGLLVLGNWNGKSNPPKLGEYSSFGHNTDIYCGSSNYIYLKENGKLEFYSKINGEGFSSCLSEGYFSIDENNILMISGLNNPNAMHLDSQFNGKYIWTKDQFDIPCFKKYNGEIVLTNYGKK